MKKNSLFQLITAEVMIKLAYHHFATPQEWMNPGEDESIAAKTIRFKAGREISNRWIRVTYRFH